MADAIQVEIVSRETIKPSSPTPEHLRYLKLSFVDQINPPTSLPMVFFYPLKGVSHPPQAISQQLKLSLSNVLTLFYPLAGTIRNNYLVECDDSGVEFSEVKVNCLIWDILKQPDSKVLQKFIPVDPYYTASNIKVQLNFFACGGLAIGIGFSHKLLDGHSFTLFLKNWAISCTNPIGRLPELVPHFVGDTVIPSMEDGLGLPPPSHLRPLPKLLDILWGKTSRFVIDDSKLALLKAKAASASVQQPTRVEALSALIWKCLMTMSRTKFGHARHSVLTHAVNIRRRLRPPLPQNYAGNLMMRSFARADGNDMELKDLVVVLRKGLQDTYEKLAKGVEINELGLSRRRDDDVDLFDLTSLGGYEGFYETDFGWGKPTWVAYASLFAKNFAMISVTSDGKGLEVWICLDKDDLSLFESNRELLEFAALNPSACGEKLLSHL